MADKAEGGALVETIKTVVYALLIAGAFRTLFFQPFWIPSGSMKDTLLIGDYILVNKFIYGVKIPFSDFTLIPIKKPQRGDILVFKYPLDPGKDFIKRAIGVPGDIIEIRDKKVFVNGQQLEEPYAVFSDKRILPATASPRDNMNAITVPENSLFVMGDNRDESDDSRFWKFVDMSQLKGKAFIIYWSWNHENHGVRWNRIGSLLS